MNIRDAYNSKAIALVQTEVASNKIACLGAGLFPAKKKMGLDLKWIKTSKGLPVSLAPSNFDAVSTLRSREGFKITETEMAFFRESMLIKEADEQEIMRVKDSTDPYAADVVISGTHSISPFPVTSYPNVTFISCPCSRYAIADSEFSGL